MGHWYRGSAAPRGAMAPFTALLPLLGEVVLRMGGMYRIRGARSCPGASEDRHFQCLLENKASDCFWTIQLP